MASATTQALTALSAALSAQTDVTEQTAEELFAAARLINESSQLSSALTDTTATADARQKLVVAAFANASKPTKDLVSVAVSQRWSRPKDLIDGLEELAIRSVAVAADKTDIEGELFSVSQVVVANPELELALGNRLGDGSAKAALASKLLSGKVSSSTELIVTSLVRAARGRRVRAMLRSASEIVANARGQIIATVHTASALSKEQHKRLADSLGRRYQSTVTIHEVVNPEVIGGLRVQIGDDVIDGSISTRLSELRQKLAG